MQFDQAKSVLHETPDQRTPILGCHREVVVAEWLESKLHAANQRTICARLSLDVDGDAAERRKRRHA
jgi:hypothetical protein